MPVRSPRRHLSRRTIAALAALLVIVAACGSDASTEEAQDEQDAAAPTGLSVAVASFDLAVGDSQRLLAGLFTDDARLLTFGEVTFQLAHLGDEAGGAGEIEQETAASFLPVPGWEPQGDHDAPTLDADDGRGVYAAEVALDEPGNWGLRVIAELEDGTELEGNTVFQVAEETQVPDIGDPAPRVPNHTVADVEEGTATAVSVDSRAQGDNPVPDTHLHDTRIVEAMDAGRPVVVIVSTPVYCRTNFCGPLVETLSLTAERYEDRAAFVHLEIYEDFDEQRLNEAAAAWIQPADGSDGGEPWVFLVDADGNVAARWDNVLDLTELERLLDELPAQQSNDEPSDEA